VAIQIDGRFAIAQSGGIVHLFGVNVPGATTFNH
jgi:hypothetical protein